MTAGAISQPAADTQTAIRGRTVAFRTLGLPRQVVRAAAGCGRGGGEMFDAIAGSLIAIWFVAGTWLVVGAVCGRRP